MRKRKRCYLNTKRRSGGQRGHDIDFCVTPNARRKQAGGTTVFPFDPVHEVVELTHKCASSVTPAVA